MLAVIAGCSSSQGPPETITFDQQPLTKATSWNREGMSGVVYVHPGKTLPDAPLQVGAIVSDDHQTAADLHAWIREQGLRSSVRPV
jgi:hypothetical protein